MPRPCLYVQCRYNLVLDVAEAQFLEHSCALDEAEDGPRSLAELADIMGLSRERVRQIEQRALRKLGMTRDFLELGQYSRGENVKKWKVLAAIRDKKKAKKAKETAKAEEAPFDDALESDVDGGDFV